MSSSSQDPKENRSGIVVHHLEDSRSQRVLWLLEELQVPYTIKHYYRDPQTHRAPRELRQVHPLGKSPVITDGGMTVGESAAIVEYLIEKYGNGRFSPVQEGKLDNLYFSHYCEGSLMPLLVNQLIFTMIPAQSPWFLRPIFGLIFNKLKDVLLVPEIKKNVEFIENHLSKAKGDWFAGGDEPTSADFMMAFPLEAMHSQSPESIGPLATKYVERVHARPAYLKALEKGGKYAYAKL